MSLIIDVQCPDWCEDRDRLEAHDEWPGGTETSHVGVLLRDGDGWSCVWLYQDQDQSGPRPTDICVLVRTRTISPEFAREVAYALGRAADLVQGEAP